MLRALFILALLWGSYCDVVAQTSFTVRGVVRDTAGLALSKATVALLSDGDRLFTISKEDGSFSFVDLGSRNIELVVSMKGYVTIRKNISVKQGVRSIDVAPILLLTDYTQLDSVVIRHLKPVIIAQDTINYIAGAFHVRDGSEVEQLLKIMPGIEVDMAGNVIVEGKKVTHARVDGKDFFGGDVLIAIRNLPADIVDKIQIIDDYGDKARLTGIKSGEPIKILNIVLRTDKRTGQFGHIQVAGGNANKYETDGFGNFFKNERQLSVNGGLENLSAAGNNYARNLLVHYADRWNKKWVGGANITLTGASPYTSSNISQDNYYANGQLSQRQSNQTNGNATNANFGSTISYMPDAYHTLRLNPFLSLQKSNQSASSQFHTDQNDSSFKKTTSGSSTNLSNNSSVGTGADIYYEQLSARSKRRMSIQANVQYNSSKATNDNLINSLIEADGVKNQSNLHYLVNNNGNSLNTSVNANYFAPLGPTAFLELSYTYNNSSTQNTKFTGEFDSTGSNILKVDSLSNDYFFQSVTHRLHTGYSAQFKKLSLSLSVDALPGNMHGKLTGKGDDVNYHYFNVLPGAQANWVLTRSNTLSFQYTGNNELPNPQQLTPLTDRSNPQYPVTGNPSLKPAFSQNLNVQYEHAALKPTQFQGFGISLGYGDIKNSITQNIIHPKDTGSIIQETTYLNAGSSSSYSVGYHLTLPSFLNKQLRISINGRFGLLRSESMTDNVLYTTRARIYSQELHLQYRPGETFESELSGNYSANHTKYLSGDAVPVYFSSADWSLSSRLILWRKWIANCAFSQVFSSGANGRLLTQPAYLTASIQRQFLPKNKLTLSISGYDMLNTNSGFSQVITSTSITRSQTNLIGRYFMVSLIWKWGKFGD